jgi:hypothetical protein
MAKFKNVSGVPQLVYLPSLHVKRDGAGQDRWWDEAAPKKILASDEILETSISDDVKYLRELTRERIVRIRGERQPRPGVLIELD